MGSPSAHGPPCSGPARVGSGYRVEWDLTAKEQAQGSLLQRQSPALREKRGGWGCRCGQQRGRARGSEVVREEQVSQVDATPARCGRTHEVREQSGHGGTQICGKTGTAQGTKWADEGIQGLAWGSLRGPTPSLAVSRMDELGRTRPCSGPQSLLPTHSHVPGDPPLSRAGQSEPSTPEPA